MKTIVINDNNLKDSDIQIFGNKVRAILLSENKILVSRYGGVVLLPGGSIDKGESDEEALIRELQEETGTSYDINQLEKLLCIKFYQPNYPTRTGELANRLITTQYYIGQFRGINLDNIRRTDSEIKGDFCLDFASVDNLLFPTEDKTNPRKEFFDRENQEVAKVLKKIQRR